MTDKEISGDENLIGHCGIYCGAYPSFSSGKCVGNFQKQRFFF